VTLPAGHGILFICGNRSATRWTLRLVKIGYRENYVVSLERDKQWTTQIWHFDVVQNHSHVEPPSLGPKKALSWANDVSVERSIKNAVVKQWAPGGICQEKVIILNQDKQYKKGLSTNKHESISHNWMQLESRWVTRSGIVPSQESAQATSLLESDDGEMEQSPHILNSINPLIIKQTAVG